MAGIKANSFYNDPAMAQAAANLAGLFDAPSGSDMSGYAEARAKRMQTDQRAELWRQALTAGDQDRMGVIADLYDPSQSYYSVDQGNLTQKYGYDTQASTSRANNAADNARALTTNRADNLAKLYTEGFGNVGTGEVQPAIPLSVLTQFGGTEAVPETRGPVRPLSEAEVKGTILGQMDQPQQEQAVLGTDTVPIYNSDGSVSLMSRAQANITGATPVLTSEQEKGRAFASLPEEQRKQSVVDIKGTDTYHAVDAQGNDRSFVGYIGSDNRIYDQAHPEKPAEGVVSKGSGGNQFAVDFNPDGTVAGIRQGAGVAGGRTTDAQMKAGFGAEMMAEPTKIIIDAFDKDKTPTLTDVAAFNVINKMATSDSFAMAAATPYMNSLLSDEGKTFFAAMQQALPYELMVRSGQAVTEGEYARKLLSMVPLPTDDPATKAIKRNAFDTAQKAILRLAGAAAKPADTATTQPSSTSSQATAAPATEISPEDRAASIANAKAAVASGDYTKEEAIKMLTDGGIVLKPGELD